jgi:hypothetical protein
MSDLHDWEREEFEVDAQRAEAAGPRKYVYRTRHRGGRKIVGGEEVADCIDEMMPLRAEFERAQLAYYESIGKWSKVLPVADVAALAGLGSRTDVYSIVRKLPRLRRANKNG